MKKRTLFLLLSLVVTASVAANGSFKITETKSTGAASLIDSVFVVKSTSNGVLSYIGGEEADYKWYSVDGEGNQTLLKEESGTDSTGVSLLDVKSVGYLLSINEDDAENKSEKQVWVFDYADYKPVITGVRYVDGLSDRCESTLIQFDKTVVPMSYYALKLGAATELDQYFKLRYDSAFFSTENKEFDSEVKEYQIPNVLEYAIPAHLGSTIFTLMGNTYSMALGDTVQFESDIVPSVAVEAHVFASVRIREEATNEKDRGEPKEPTEVGDDILQMKGSAPVNIECLTYASEAAYFYEWRLAKDNKFTQTIVKGSDPDFRYTLKDFGTYYLRLQVSNRDDMEKVKFNPGCTKEKMIKIDVMQSIGDTLISVPNVFTPNGDGKNDEFKVAYRSIIEFHGYIYSLWGRLVYEWNDPALGWDGTINGKDAPDSAYMYIITATGFLEDGTKKTVTKKGTVSIVR